MNLFAQFYNSITNLESYKYFLKQSFGKAFLYLFLTSIILAGIGGFKTIYDFNAGINDTVKYFKTDFPPFELKNGELEVTAEMPYVLAKNEKEIVIIDTSGKVDETILNDYNNGIFVSKYGIDYKKNTFETRKIDFSSLNGVTFTKETLLKWLPYLKWFSLIIIFFGFFFYLVGKLISALFVSIGGIIIAKILKHEIRFGDLYKLSIYSLTSSILVYTIKNLSGLTIPFFSLIYYGIALIYLWNVLKILKDHKTDINDTDFIQTEDGAYKEY